MPPRTKKPKPEACKVVVHDDHVCAVTDPGHTVHVCMGGVSTGDRR